jgi:hypothetical protein
MATPATPLTSVPVVTFPTEIEFSLKFRVAVEDAEQLSYFQNPDGNVSNKTVADLFDALDQYWTITTINNETLQDVHSALCAEAGVS